MPDLLDKIAVFEERARRLEERVADPALARDRKAFAEVGRELAAVRPILAAGESYRRTRAGIESARAMLTARVKDDHGRAPHAISSAILTVHER